MNGSVLINRVFDSVKVNENLDKFSNVLADGYLTTMFDNRQICKVEVSKIYYNFDFTTFSKSILSEIQKYFTPEKYMLKVASGVQEIRLVGDEIFIDNERFEKIISIVNSTDKSRALSMNVGLSRADVGKSSQYCIILTNFSNKHYKASLPEKIKSFSRTLPTETLLNNLQIINNDISGLFKIYGTESLEDLIMICFGNDKLFINDEDENGSIKNG